MPQLIEDGLVTHLLDVAELDGKHHAQAKAENMLRVVNEIIAHSVTGRPQELLRVYREQLEIVLSVL